MVRELGATAEDVTAGRSSIVSKVVSSETRNDVAIVWVDNPPVNALGVDVRRRLSEAIIRAADDPAVKAVVIVGAGRIFISGADIREFGQPLQPPGLVDVIDRIEACDKPVIAAIHGVALGGGLEVALGCHFRLASKETKLGLPEVKLGLLPGAGGTQRLPRAVGPELAVKMIVGGAPITATEALQAGLIDEIFEGDPVAAAESFACKILADKRPIRRLCHDDSRLADAKAARSIFANAAAAATKRSRGLDAPLAAAEAVGWSLDLPFRDALQRESGTFLRLMNGSQSKAQRHAFFAEREAAKIPNISQDARPRLVKSVAIIGAGTMGGGIAMSFANAGIPVTLIETTEPQLARGLKVIEDNYRATALRGGISAGDVEKRIGLIKGVTGLDKVADADLVIEAAFETMAVKLDIFGQLDRLAKPGAVLASNTSYLDINKIAQATKRPGDVLGMHFFSPASVMKLCEVVRGAQTDPEVLATAVKVARRIEKIPAVVGVCFGFVGNRMLEVRGLQASKLLYAGALPHEIDAVLTRFGMPMGHFAMIDLAGLDIGWRSRQDRGVKSPIEDSLCEAGRFGQKAGRGYFKYEPGSRRPLQDEAVERLIVETMTGLGLKRRAIPKEEMLERLLYPMINEGARILEEGIAARPGDIDVVWLHGYGWPVSTGGPMFHADRIGLKHIVDKLNFYAAEDKDPSVKPTASLKELAETQRGFFDAN
jgi:3-hydroxyacyl-CoA dehydrogenase